MSTWRERLEEAGRPAVAADWLAENYHVPALLALVLYGLWVRTINWSRFVVDGVVQFRGNDAYYHLRSVQYVVDHWPATMPFDPWTNFPTGTSTAQFGTLFDQLIAAGALVIGLGNPSDELIRLVLLFAPAIFGIATLVPAYLIGKRLGGKFGGVVAAGIISLAATDLLIQGSVGSSDHHVAEALFQALAVLGVMVAVSVAEREKPVYELLADREFGAIRQTLGWSLLAGVAVGVYLSVWPPGVLLLGILGVFLLIHLSADFLRGRSPEHVAIASAVAMVTAGVMALSTVNSLEISATARSLLQPGLAFAVAAGCVFMAWLARTWEDRDLPTLGYPAAVAGVALFLAITLALLTPDFFGYLVNNVRRVVGFQLTETSGTVGEAQPLRDPARLTRAYKLAAVGAVLGAGTVLFDHVVDEEPQGEQLMIVVWAVFLTAAIFTQRRFMYYLAVPVASLNALLVGRVVSWVNRTSTDDGVENFQLLTVAAVILVVLAPLVLFQPTAMDVANSRGGTIGGVVGWQSGLDWVEENTPVPGRYDNPDGEVMSYLGTYGRTDDFDYPAGAYGVLSWWDYGHWITAIGGRIPNANPFQQGSGQAAQFLLAQNESRAEELLSANDEDDASTQLVMVDWKMIETETAVGGKFFAPPSFVDGVQRSDYFSRMLNQGRLDQTGNVVAATTLVRHKPAYYDTMVARLYHYHGSAAEPRPVVLSWQGSERPYGGGTYTFTPSQENPDDFPLTLFRTMEEAEAHVEESPTSRQIGGVGANPTHRVPALEHYRLVHMSATSSLESGGFVAARSRTVQRTDLAPALGYPANRSGQLRAMDWLFRTSPSWTKTFERVPGATIEGTGPPNTTVTARLTLDPENGNAFRYRQRTTTDDSGAFEMTVPYASTGYDEWGLAEGYTNASVRPANESRGYTIATGTAVADGNVTQHVGTVHVTEGQVLGENPDPSRVTLEERTSQLLQPGGTDGSATNGTNGTDESNQTGTDAGADGGSQGSLGPLTLTRPSGKVAAGP